MAAVLFLSYDGLTDPLGQSQILPYIEGLSRRGHQFHLISFEKPERLVARRGLIADRCAAAGITWHPLRYTKRPPILSTAIDLALMLRKARSLHRQHRFDLVHARSYLAAIVGSNLQRAGCRFVFDMRGFWADERVDAGLWAPDRLPYRPIYRYFKRREREWLRRADAVVVLTEAAHDVIDGWFGVEPHAPISMIPCVADLDVLIPPSAAERSAARAELGVGDEGYLLVYAGGVGGWYLTEDILRFFAELRRVAPAPCRFLFLTPHAPGPITAQAAALGLPEDAVDIRFAERSELASLLGAADAGISFIRPTFSKRGSSPTKLGEYLACGLAIVANSGVGDVDRLITDHGAGVLVRGFEQRELRSAACELLERVEPAASYRAIAEKHFNLDDAIDRYADVYEQAVKR